MTSTCDMCAESAPEPRERHFVDGESIGVCEECHWALMEGDIRV